MKREPSISKENTGPLRSLSASRTGLPGAERGWTLLKSQLSKAPKGSEKRLSIKAALDNEYAQINAKKAEKKASEPKAKDKPVK